MTALHWAVWSDLYVRCRQVCSQDFNVALKIKTAAVTHHHDVAIIQSSELSWSVSISDSIKTNIRTCYFVKKEKKILFGEKHLFHFSVSTETGQLRYWKILKPLQTADSSVSASSPATLPLSWVIFGQTWLAIRLVSSPGRYLTLLFQSSLRVCPGPSLSGLSP